jgi:ribosomal protein S18 acetylase RimI-like enzyme
MASCYGKTSFGSAPSGNEATLQRCPYLPLSLPFNEPAEVELTVFSTDSEYEQGMQLMNDVIVEGKSWPYLEVYETMEAYKGYFHSHSSFLVRFKDQTNKEILGCFYIKPNFPGRCSHICNGGFITNPKYRGLGVGSIMGEHFKRLAKDLGYRASLFNLVFASNKASVRLWTKLGYTRLAVIPKVAVLEGEMGYVDAYQMHCDFYPEES